MAKTAEYKFRCDLCGAIETSKEDQLPKKWLNFLVENPFVSRDFTEKHICNDCCKEISERYAKRA